MSRPSRESDKPELQGLLSSIPQSDYEQGDYAAAAASSNDEQRPSMHRKAVSLYHIPTGGPRRKAHHRYKSSLGNIVEGLENIATDVQTEYKLVRDTFENQLEDTVQGKRYFLDMTMTRSLSVLPEGINDLVEEATGHEQPQTADTVGFAVIGRYLALLSAVLAVSSNGTALALLKGVSPTLKMYWRMTVTAIVLSPFALRTLYQQGGLPKLHFSEWLVFCGAVLCFFLMILLLYNAFEYTSIGNAVIGANSQALLLILAKAVMGETVVFLEGFGVVLAFSGCLLCSSDEARNAAAADDPRKASTALFGDLLAFASAIAGVMYLTFAKTLRPTMSVTVFMFFIMCCSSLCVLTYMAVFETNAVHFTTDPYNGLFGWFSYTDHHIYILLFVAIVCNVVGTMGFVRAMQFFDNIIIAVATLLEPMAATIIAFVIGVGELPGFMGWAGNALVAMGTLAVVYPSINKPMEH